MNLAEEYKISQYQDLSSLNEKGNVRLVRNAITGKIAVKKTVRLEQKYIYVFLQFHENPYIPDIYECLEYDSQCVIIEEYIEGRTLADVLHEKHISEEKASFIVKKICHALHPLHTATPSIVCRDLKPENIMITSFGEVKLVDFDIARIVQPDKNRDTVVMGTEGFAAPEQFGHGQTDPRSDIYTLGILLNYLLLEKFPVEEIANGKLGEIIRKCIAINPQERYQSVMELSAELEKIYPTKNQTENNKKLKSDKEFQSQEISWRRYLPPGFRSGSLWKMIVSCIGYFLIGIFCFTMEMVRDDVVISGPLVWIERTLLFLAQIGEVGIIFDYMGIRSRIPFLREQSRFISFFGYIACWFLLLIGFAVISVLLEDFFL